MKSTQTKYFIVSLPRTGTKSLCQMMSILGFTTKHVPSTSLPHLLLADKITVFADTPIYRPSVISNLIKTETNKFIYCVKSADEWVKSFEKVKLHHNYEKLRSGEIAENHVNALDRDSMGEIFMNLPYDNTLAGNLFNRHKNFIDTKIPKNRILYYDFNNGWEPLCSFVNKNIPSVPIPHLNKDTMFDPIIL